MRKQAHVSDSGPVLCELPSPHILGSTPLRLAELMQIRSAGRGSDAMTQYNNSDKILYFLNLDLKNYLLELKMRNSTVHRAIKVNIVAMRWMVLPVPQVGGRACLTSGLVAGSAIWAWA